MLYVDDERQPQPPVRMHIDYIRTAAEREAADSRRSMRSLRAGLMEFGAGIQSTGTALNRVSQVRRRGRLGCRRRPSVSPRVTTQFRGISRPKVASVRAIAVTEMVKRVGASSGGTSMMSTSPGRRVMRRPGLGGSNVVKVGYSNA